MVEDVLAAVAIFTAAPVVVLPCASAWPTPLALPAVTGISSVSP